MKSKAPEETTKLLEEAGGGAVSGSGTSGSGTWTTKLRGIVALFTAAILVTVSRVSVQALDKAIPDFQLNLMRCATAMARNITNDRILFKISESMKKCKISNYNTCNIYNIEIPY